MLRFKYFRRIRSRSRQCFLLMLIGVVFVISSSPSSFYADIASFNPGNRFREKAKTFSWMFQLRNNNPMENRPNFGSSWNASTSTESSVETMHLDTDAKSYYVSFSKFRYPLDANLRDLVTTYKVKTGNVTKKVINEYKYSFSVNPTSKCVTTDKIFLLYLIKSTHSNFERRKVIRDTWGSEALSKDFIIRRVFLLGSTGKLHNNMRLLKEINSNGDILQMSFIDSYYNNTLKSIGGLKWTTEFCNNTKFVIFADDDFFFATDVILKYLDSLHPESVKSLFMGKRGTRSVERWENGKWSMSPDEYPFDRYPPYIVAGAMFLSYEFAVDLYIATKFVKLFRFDDVYFGIVAYKLGVVVQTNSQIMVSRYPPVYDKKEFKKVLAAHGFGNPISLRKLWMSHLSVMRNKAIN